MVNSLLSCNWKVIGLDAITDYYDVNLKKARQDILSKDLNFHNYNGFIQNKNLLNEIHLNHRPNVIIHLAAQAGVRYSIQSPHSYVESNLRGTFNILELAKRSEIDHLIIASTSSVYGNNQDMPFDENQKTDTPLSFYAATKKSNEVMAHSYSHLFSIPTTVLRFFTVYGPWGRPDMALFKFTENILSQNPIDIYNYGKMKRDFTYVSDLVEAICLMITKKPLIPSNRKTNISSDSLSNCAPYRVVNIGNANPVDLMDYIVELEKALGVKAIKNFLPMQEGDVLETYSNIDLLINLTGFYPKKTLKQGIIEFVNWYKNYYIK